MFLSFSSPQHPTSVHSSTLQVDYFPCTGAAVVVVSLHQAVLKSLKIYVFFREQSLQEFWQSVRKDCDVVPIKSQPEVV